MQEVGWFTQYSCQLQVVRVVGLLPCIIYLAFWAQVAGRGSVGRERLSIGVQTGHMVQVWGEEREG